MHKLGWISICLLIIAIPALAQQTQQTYTEQELSVIEAIKAQNRTLQESAPSMQAAPDPTQEADDAIQLSDQTKQQALEQPAEKAASDETGEEPAVSDASNKKCLTVAFIDIDVAFNEHPRTQAVKKQIDTKIKSKQREVENAKDIIAALEAENEMLTRQLATLKPFYEQIAFEQPLLPKVQESADTLQLNNTLNRLLFSGCEILSTSPLNTPARLDDITERMSANKKIIAERSFFIDNYKYQTREEILKLEQEEVKAILQDIYDEIKTFARKRNIGAVVRKDEILYGQKPVNVTSDFVNRLKKSKKYRKK